MPDPATKGASPEVRVSVIMPVYNGQEFLAEAMSSVLHQSFRDFELVVVDDCSTDSTPEIVRGFADGRVRYLRNSTNQGLTKSLNIAWSAARGEYLARMDADDVSLPERFLRQVEFLDSHPEVAVVGCAAEFFGSFESVVRPLTSHDAIRCQMLVNCPMVHPTVMLRRAEFDRLDLRYDPKCAKAQDYDLWSRAVHEVRFANLPEVLFRYRVHGNQVSVTGSVEQTAVADRVRSRLIGRLVSGLSTEDLDVYCRMARLGSLKSYEELNHLDRVLVRVVLANRKDGQEQPVLLEKLLLDWFSAACCHSESRALVAAYWQSQLRKLVGATFSHDVRFIAREAKRRLRQVARWAKTR